MGNSRRRRPRRPIHVLCCAESRSKHSHAHERGRVCGARTVVCGTSRTRGTRLQGGQGRKPAGKQGTGGLPSRRLVRWRKVADTTAVLSFVAPPSDGAGGGLAICLRLGSRRRRYKEDGDGVMNPIPSALPSLCFPCPRIDCPAALSKAVAAQARPTPRCALVRRSRRLRYGLGRSFHTVRSLCEVIASRSRQQAVLFTSTSKFVVSSLFLSVHACCSPCRDGPTAARSDSGIGLFARVR